jgi:hypothetical protein
MAILRRGLAKDPAYRYPEASALAADLSRLAAEDQSGPRHAVTQAVTTVATPRPASSPPGTPGAPQYTPPGQAPAGLSGPPPGSPSAPLSGPLSGPPSPAAGSPLSPLSPPAGGPVGAPFARPPHPSMPPGHPGPGQPGPGQQGPAHLGAAHPASAPPGSAPRGARYPPSGPPPLHAPSGPPPRSRNRSLVVAGAALAAALLVLAGVWYFAIRESGSGGGDDRVAAGSGSGDETSAADGDVQRFGVPTVTEGCPAAAVPDAGARCTKRAQCWSGIVIIQGQLGSIRELDCAEGHVYETFAIAAIPPAVVDPYQDELAADASVQQVCSTETMLASRVGDARKYGADKWSIEILPPTPDDLAAGRDIYRCVATLTGIEGVTGSAFRPR